MHAENPSAHALAAVRYQNRAAAVLDMNRQILRNVHIAHDEGADGVFVLSGKENARHTRCRGRALFGQGGMI